jgi:tetratricopeptide (TPR) repeat protein
MHSKRRALLQGLASAGALALVHVSSEGRGMKDIIKVKIKLQDEMGKPIPFVTAWGFVGYAREHARNHGQFQYLQSSDLDRLTRRHHRLHEVVTAYGDGDRPVTTLGVPPLGNENGEFFEEIDYTDRTGSSNNYSRPDTLMFGYSFMKQGYQPGRIDFSVAKNESMAQATVTLKRNPAEAIETAPYIQTFHRLRYELSLPQDMTVTPENQRRVQAFGEQLEAAAQQALAAGDSKAAARIYLRMRYLPSVIYQRDGTVEIAGFLQSKLSSPESQRAQEKAFKLDPDNLYVLMKTINLRHGLPATAPLEQRIRSSLNLLEQLINRFGEEVWPDIYQLRAGFNKTLGDYAKARELYLQAAEFEPKYTDWAKVISDMKLSMKRKGVPVPEGW